MRAAPLIVRCICEVPDKKRNTFETRLLLLRQTALLRAGFGFSSGARSFAAQVGKKKCLDVQLTYHTNEFRRVPKIRALKAARGCPKIMETFIRARGTRYDNIF